MLHRFGQQRLASLALVILVCMLFLSGFAKPRAFAHPVASEQIHAVINGRVYTMTVGHKLTFPITYPDGSKGSVSYMVSIGDVKTADTIYCKTAGANETYYNVFGQTLASYTHWQYWCYDFQKNIITDANHPYDTVSTYYGWSLAENYESLQLSGIGSNAGYSLGEYRFNGPFGIGCESGQLQLFFYANGGYSPQFYGGHYFGC